MVDRAAQLQQRQLQKDAKSSAATTGAALPLCGISQERQVAAQEVAQQKQGSLSGTALTESSTAASKRMPSSVIAT